MPHTRTRVTGLRLREVGTLFPPHLVNSWGSEINDELRVIDEAIGAICTQQQIEAIKRALYQQREGVFL